MKLPLAQILGRHLRHARVKPVPKAKLRLDALEGREMPGGMTDGLVAGLTGAAMLDPLAVMDQAVGLPAGPLAEPDASAVNEDGVKTSAD